MSCRYIAVQLKVVDTVFVCNRIIVGVIKDFQLSGWKNEENVFIPHVIFERISSIFATGERGAINDVNISTFGYGPVLISNVDLELFWVQLTIPGFHVDDHSKWAAFPHAILFPARIGNAESGNKRAILRRHLGQTELFTGEVARLGHQRSVVVQLKIELRSVFNDVSIRTLNEIVLELEIITLRLVILK